ncbi:hypothetical protein [Chitinophaga qingshengii]|uniref:ADP-ribosylation/crystallin J1 n=1 Tax=Chitinophaga qingshengii TaxID=1569794 RepID=A0ABR7TJ85_9BACT|nr:hypothetical protein [Chitinophaga qingshengii]MBC9929725.1 hypothetical protein [Chitinophaga qingshengii]
MTTTLYRLIEATELQLIEQSGWKRFPPRLTSVIYFHPTLTEAYALEIAKEWFTPPYSQGYVIRFEMNTEFLKAYPPRKAFSNPNEYWIPIEDMGAVNEQLSGLIAVIHRNE